MTLRKDEAEGTAVFAKRNVDACAPMVHTHNVFEADNDLISGLCISELLGEHEATVVSELEGPQFLTSRLSPSQEDGGRPGLIRCIFGVAVSELSVCFHLEPKERPSPVDGGPARYFALRGKDANLRAGGINDGKLPLSQEQIVAAGTLQVDVYGHLVARGAEWQIRSRDRS
jgi:hypothetical protein